MPDETTSFELGAASARLLVVDDEENIVLTISEVLRLEGYEVDVAASGQEAVCLLDEGRDYDLVLTDLPREEGDGLATLSHELRTPLTPVLGWVNLLRTSSPASDPALLTQGLDAIERNARLQARLVDDLLDISRIVSGKLRIEWEPVNLCAIVESSVETVRAGAASRDIELAVETPDCPLIVQGAPVRLQQVVWNLLSNAVKFTPRAGRVAVRGWRERG